MLKVSDLKKALETNAVGEGLVKVSVRMPGQAGEVLLDVMLAEAVTEHQIPYKHGTSATMYLKLSAV